MDDSMSLYRNDAAYCQPFSLTLQVVRMGTRLMKFTAIEQEYALFLE